jgi:hypothetical protein
VTELDSVWTSLEDVYCGCWCPVESRGLRVTPVANQSISGRSGGAAGQEQTATVRALVSNEHERILHLTSNAKSEPRVCRWGRHVEIKIIACCVEPKGQSKCLGSLMLICVGRRAIGREGEESKPECFCMMISNCICIMCRLKQKGATYDTGSRAPSCQSSMSKARKSINCNCRNTKRD